MLGSGLTLGRRGHIDGQAVTADGFRAAAFEADAAFNVIEFGESSLAVAAGTRGGERNEHSRHAREILVRSEVGMTCAHGAKMWDHFRLCLR